MVMTEKQKMLAGMKYYNTDEELSADRWRTRKQINRFNDLFKEDPTAANTLLSSVIQANREKV